MLVPKLVEINRELVEPVNAILYVVDKLRRE